MKEVFFVPNVCLHFVLLVNLVDDVNRGGIIIFKNNFFDLSNTVM